MARETQVTSQSCALYASPGICPSSGPCSHTSGPTSPGVCSCSPTWWQMKVGRGRGWWNAALELLGIYQYTTRAINLDVGLVIAAPRSLIPWPLLVERGKEGPRW